MNPAMSVSPTHPRLLQALSSAQLTELCFPVVDVASEVRGVNEEAYNTSKSCPIPGVWPDRTMHSVARHLQEPKVAALTGEARKISLLPFTDCFFSQDSYDHPVIASDGYTYSFAGIQRWWQTEINNQRQPTSPMNRQKITDVRLIPNSAMAALMVELGLSPARSTLPSEKIQLVTTNSQGVDSTMSRRLSATLYYQHNASAALADSDRHIAALGQKLRDEAISEGHLQAQIRTALASLKVKAKLHILAKAPKYKNISPLAKIERAIDVALLLGDVRRAERLVRAGLAENPHQAVLRSRLAFVEAVNGHSRASEIILAQLLSCEPQEATLHAVQLLSDTPEGLRDSVWPLFAAAGILLCAAQRQEDGQTLKNEAKFYFPSRLI